MTEWKDFLEGAQLTERQYEILHRLDVLWGRFCDLRVVDSEIVRDRVADMHRDFDSLKELLAQEFTGTRIV